MCPFLTYERELPLVSETTVRDQVFQTRNFQQMF